MFRNRRQLRRWAARVLLLWLFGVAASVAHACLAPNVVGLSDAALASPAALRAAHHDASAAPVPHHGPAASQPAPTPGEPEPMAHLNCQDFCDKATVSMPQQKSTLDDVHGAALPLRTASAVLAVPALPRARPWVPRRDGVWSPPIPIAFLRLAL